MKNSTIKADVLLLLSASIWGSAFVAQRIGMDYMGPMLFNGVRFALGALVILPFALRGWGATPTRDRNPWHMLRGGALAGVILFSGAGLQQIGLIWTTAGKAGFISGLYVIMVPLLGLVVGHRAGRGLWFGAILAAIGLYFLSVTETLTIEPGDSLMLASTVFWALHVLVLGHLAGRLHAIRLAFVQFVVCALLSLLAAAIYEKIELAMLIDGFVPILYGGVLSVGIAYTVQVLAQRDAVPAHAAIILSLESVFAALAGWLVLNEVLTSRDLLGCSLMLVGMLAAQVLPILGRRLSPT